MKYHTASKKDKLKLFHFQACKNLSKISLNKKQDTKGVKLKT